jgi:hypothetical protein
LPPFIVYPNAPEYPQNPAAHLNKPATISIKGSISHCETEPRAGHKNADSGKVGVRTSASALERCWLTFMTTLAVGFLTALRLGFGVEGAWPAIVTDVEKPKDESAASRS